MYLTGKSSRLADTHEKVGFRGRKKPSEEAPDCRCPTCHDEGWLHCPRCAGSGEGMADGSQCWWCEGEGEVRCPGEEHEEV